METHVDVRAPIGRAVGMVRWFVHLLFAVCVVVGGAKAVGEGAVAVGVVMTLALGGWYLVGLLLERRRRTRGAAVAWLIGLTALVLAAIVLSSDFAWVSFALFVLYATVLPARAALGAIAVSALAVGGLLWTFGPTSSRSPGMFFGTLIGAGVAAGLAGVYRTATAELAERQALIDRLVAAQADLDAARVQAAVRTERERLAAEIHDTLAQTLASLVMAARRARRDHPEPAVDELEALAGQALDQARRLVAALPPAELDARSLPDALAALGRRASGDGAEGPPEVRVRIDGRPVPLGGALDTVVLRVAAEALTNAVRHAAAGHVALTLTYGTGEVTIDVVDDGRGFDPTRPPPDGFGLRGMAARVTAAGGRFDVESTEGLGTAVTATLPLDPGGEVDPGAAADLVPGRAP